MIQLEKIQVDSCAKCGGLNEDLAGCIQETHPLEEAEGKIHIKKSIFHDGYAFKMLSTLPDC